ncbi:MAG: HNH endonuclease [Bacteroidetes bacterium]|nr:HNH endonuclease [Bacteroidota bacterium]MBU1720489.1 HNH endonuclease [Bacteroidota bacterium]
MAKNIWTREEHILAFNLYCKIQFAKINATYAPVKELAQILGRSDGSAAMKLANFARLDPALQARNISGLTQGAKGEVDVWNEFNGNWEELAFESERILAKYKNKPIEKSANIFSTDLPPEGKERDAVVKTRVNQSFFRSSVLASYNYKCCITGIAIPEMLIAGHILPWSVSQIHRTNPANGLCLNALHDKAFEIGYLTITPDYQIKISSLLLTQAKNETVNEYFIKYHNREMILPSRFLPDPEFLKYHNQDRFLP